VERQEGWGRHRGEAVGGWSWTWRAGLVGSGSGRRAGGLLGEARPAGGLVVVGQTQTEGVGGGGGSLAGRVGLWAVDS
jgi:hypothetical protein